ncbi:hypothetical protein GOP47_0030493 [Adiantum capillus-veneris]|nr:hypothetical protein GOP47_0030493 [Adiantum capillus-veneris]
MAHALSANKPAAAPHAEGYSTAQGATTLALEADNLAIVEAFLASLEAPYAATDNAAATLAYDHAANPADDAEVVVKPLNVFLGAASASSHKASRALATEALLSKYHVSVDHLTHVPDNHTLDAAANAFVLANGHLVRHPVDAPKQSNHALEAPYPHKSPTLLEVITSVPTPFNLDLLDCYGPVPIHYGNQTPCHSSGVHPRRNGGPPSRSSIAPSTPNLQEFGNFSSACVPQARFVPHFVVRAKITQDPCHAPSLCAYYKGCFRKCSSNLKPSTAINPRRRDVRETNATHHLASEAINTTLILGKVLYLVSHKHSDMYLANCLSRFM